MAVTDNGRDSDIKALAVASSNRLGILQVLGVVARGYSRQQIAKQIVVGVKPVGTYRSRLTQKLGVRTPSDVVRFAVQMRLTPETLEAEEGTMASAVEG